MERFSEKDFLDDAAAAPWKQVVQSSSDINDLVSKWVSLFSSLIDKHAPYREIRTSLKILSEKETIYSKQLLGIIPCL